MIGKRVDCRVCRLRPSRFRARAGAAGKRGPGAEAEEYTADLACDLPVQQQARVGGSASPEAPPPPLRPRVPAPST